MKTKQRIFIFFIIFSLNFIVTEIGFSQLGGRNPFKNWFPVIEKEPEEERPEEPIVFFEPEPTFDVSIYAVEGLIWGPYKPKAIINGEIYGIGDKLGEAEITKINKDGVILIFDNEEYMITTKKTINIKEQTEGVGDEF